MRLFIVIIFICSYLFQGNCQILKSDSIEIHFISEAPLETIEASNNMASGILDLETNRFAFKVAINNFEGFNNDLQRVHFMESYLESSDYPHSTFQGRILNPDDLIDHGESWIKVKGILNIHGIEDERIIEVFVQKKLDSSFFFKSSFNVLLVDHDINIPRIVRYKISESIMVEVSGELR